MNLAITDDQYPAPLLQRTGIRVIERAFPPLVRKAWGILPNSLPPSKRLVAIGDVHGRWDLLSTLIRAINAKISTLPDKQAKLIVLGDFIDRGPGSSQVVELLRKASGHYANFVVLRGNHEESFIAAAHGDGHAQKLWLTHGGQAMLQSFGIEPPYEREDSFSFAARLREGIGIDVLEWMMDLPVQLYEPPYFFCHAGIRPGVPLHKQDQQDMLWIRREFMESTLDHKAIIVHGHNVVKDVQVHTNRISLDTGAYRSGNLSAAILDSEQIVLLQTVTDLPQGVP